MKSSAVCFIAILLARNTSAFSWSSCSSSPVAEIRDFKLTPAVISLSGSISISAQFFIKEDIRGPVRLKTSIAKNSGFLAGQEIPCQGGLIGSCTVTDLCAEFPNVCPVSAGLREVKEFTYKIPPISAFIRWMAEGSYKGRAVATDANGREIGCVSFDVNLIS